MRISMAVLGVLIALQTSSAAQTIDRQKLRDQILLPGITISLSWMLSSALTGDNGGIAGTSDLPAQIASLRKAMQGDSSDAERYDHLGMLYEEMNDPADSKSAYTHAIALYQRQLKTTPDKARMLAQLGVALFRAGKQAEAEAALWQAVKANPKEWRAWTELGALTWEKAWTAPPLMPLESGLSNSEEIFAWIVQHQRYPKQPTRTQRLFNEAVRYYDRAITVAPNTPEPYGARAGFRILEACWKYLVNAASPDAQPAFYRRWSEAVADMLRAVRLRQNDLRMVAMAAMLEVYQTVLKSGGPFVPESAGQFWNMLPARPKQSVEATIGRLEKLAQSEAPKAAEAAEAAGLMQMMLSRGASGSSQAEADFRRAITLDSSRPLAWEALTGVLVSSERWQDLETLMQERLKHEDTVHTRLLLAKVYSRLNKLDQSEECVRAALKMNPNNFTGNLALADLLLKRSHDTDSLNNAGEQLVKAGKLYPKSATGEQWADYELTRGIYMALQDDTAQAKEILTQLVQRNAYDEKVTEAAKKALEVLKPSF